MSKTTPPQPEETNKPATAEEDFNIWNVPFTMENCLKAKARRRQELINLPIDEKIKIAESLRERVEVIRRWKKAHGRA